MVLFPGGAFGERKNRDRDTRARCGQKSKGGGEREEPTERERERPPRESQLLRVYRPGKVGEVIERSRQRERERKQGTTREPPRMDDAPGAVGSHMPICL